MKFTPTLEDALKFDDSIPESSNITCYCKHHSEEDLKRMWRNLEKALTKD